MISERVLDLAVGKGLISEGQALALRSLAREVEAPRPLAEPVDEERLRFVTGFADIFVTMGLGLFLGAAMYFVGMSLQPAGSLAVLAAMSWALAEFFTRRRRMALPSIVLLLVFVCSAFAALTIAVGAGKGGASFLALWGWGRRFGIGPMPDAAAMPGIVVAALATCALAALHYWRFRVPITMAAGVSALAMAIVTALTALAPEAMKVAATPVVLCLGLSIFGLAMSFDLSDPHRETRRTDIAFWLHLLAAPMIVHSVFRGLGVQEFGIGTAASLLVLAIFTSLALVAILVDRRALLVSGLFYAGWAFAALIRTIGFSDATGPLTILVLGAFVLLLSAGWTSLRLAILSRLPPAFAARLPPHVPRHSVR